MIEFELSIDEEFCSHPALGRHDRIHPTGSTAYALSANGPILHSERGRDRAGAAVPARAHRTPDHAARLLPHRHRAAAAARRLVHFDG